MLWDGPGDTETIVGGRPAAQLVNKDKAGGGGGLQDTRRLKHLRHKRGDSLSTTREYLGKARFFFYVASPWTREFHSRWIFGWGTDVAVFRKRLWNLTVINADPDPRSFIMYDFPLNVFISPFNLSSERGFYSVFFKNRIY